MLFKVQRLTKKEQLAQFKLMNKGNIEARNKLIESVVPLIMSTVKRFNSYNSYQDDLISDALLHFTKVVNQWKPSRGELTTFAVRCTINLINNKRYQYYSLVGIGRNTILKINSSKDDDELNHGDKIAKSVLFNKKELKDVMYDVYYKNDRNDEFEDIKLKLKSMSVTERRFLKMRFINNLSFTEIGEKYGFSRQYASFFMKKILDKLKET